MAEPFQLRGKEVAITGRLASMSREEAVACLAEAGAVYVATPSEATSLLVYGQGGPPLGEDGRPTSSLRRAEELQGRGVPIRIVPEEEWLALLGLEEQQEGLRRLYTPEQLSRILDVPLKDVRSWVRHELIHPVKVVKRLPFFDYQQVATARSLSQLTRAGVSPAEIRKSLSRLSNWVEEGDSSATLLEVLEQCGTVLVRLEDGSVAEPTGQLRLGFDEESKTRLTGPRSLADTRPNATEAEGWFERGIDAEESGRLNDAVQAYRRALAVDQPPPEAAFNLGNAFYALELLPEAAASYAHAVEIDAEYVEAWNNLGIVLAELFQTKRAIDSYRRALAVAPDYADAHYNLAETLAANNDWEGARRHWQAYLEEDPSSTWAREVRQRLLVLERVGAPG